MAGVISGARIRHTPKDEQVRFVDIIYSSKSPTAPFITVDFFLPESVRPDFTEDMQDFEL